MADPTLPGAVPFGDHRRPAVRHTKIVATLGPATDAPGVVEAMVGAGLDGARLNCSHGDPEHWVRRAGGLRAAAASAGRHVALLFDLQGPKIRLTDRVTDGWIAAGEEVILAAGEGAPPGVLGVAWPELADAVRPGRSEIVLGDGTPRLRVEAVRGSGAAAQVICRCERAGQVAARRGVFVTFAEGGAPAMTSKDLDDLDVAVAAGADLVALSFVRSAADVDGLRDAIAARGGRARVVAKIEKLEAFAALDEILEVADGVMVARGDLGVEAGVAQVPLLQKEIIARATRAGRLVITATQMLESMVRAPEPTRAEAADVANAIIDGTSALMLSAETAVGRHPVEAVRAMAEIALAAQGAAPFAVGMGAPEPTPGAVMQAAVHLGAQIRARALICPTLTGGSARAAAKYRPGFPVIALAHHAEVADQLALDWGVVPAVLDGDLDSVAGLVERSLDRARRVGDLADGDPVVLVYGSSAARRGSTNLIVVRHIGDPTE